MEVSSIPSRYQVSLQNYLVGMILAVIVPIMLFATGVIFYLWSTQRDQFRERHEVEVANLAVLVAQDVEDSLSRLRLLAASPFLRDEDPTRLIDLARAVFLRHTPGWQSIRMVEVPGGRQVFNLAATQGTPLPPSGDRPHQLRAVVTRSGAVSDLFQARESGQWVVEAVVPVIAGGEVRYLLTATIDIERLSALLGSRVKASDVAVIVDRNLTIIARTRDQAHFIGKQTVPPLHAMMKDARVGWSRFTAFEGDSVYSAWAPVGDTGWTVAYGISAAPLESALARSLTLLATTGLIVFGLAMGLAFVAARRMVRAIDNIGAAAAGAARGVLPPPAATGVSELDRLHTSLRDAAQRIVAEAGVRAAAEKERDALFEKERDARARAEAESRSKDEFLATLGHELRNPLAAMSNATHVLEKTAGEDPRNALPLAILRRQTAQQQRLLDDLLDIARVTTGKLRLQRTRIDLAAAVRSALATMDNGGRLARHALTAALDEAWIEADLARIEQVIVNLVGNALKFTPAGGEIAVSTGIEGSDAVLRVRDKGAGIDAETLPRVFDLFAQHDPTPDHVAGGLGIGLTLVRRIAMLHGGSVEAASSGRGQGATLTVRLPRGVDLPGTVTTPEPAPANPARVRILVVEDNEDVGDMLRIALDMTGHEVLAVGTGRDALAAAADAVFDVGILDIGLPDMSGIELAQKLRERHGAGIMLVAVSGFGSVEGAHRQWFDIIYVKPLDIAALIAAIERRVTVSPRDAAMAESAAPNS